MDAIYPARDSLTPHGAKLRGRDWIAALLCLTPPQLSDGIRRNRHRPSTRVPRCRHVALERERTNSISRPSTRVGFVRSGSLGFICKLLFPRGKGHVPLLRSGPTVLEQNYSTMGTELLWKGWSWFTLVY